MSRRLHDPSLTRPDGWRVALDAFVAGRMAMPFAWGRNDCCLFAADAVLAMTGRDLAAGYRGQYASALQGAHLLEQLGGLEALGDRAGPRCPPLTAQPGDIGLVQCEDRRLLAVCHGACWLAPTGGGLAALPFAAAAVAWRVARG